MTITYLVIFAGIAIVVIAMYYYFINPTSRKYLRFSSNDKASSNKEVIYLYNNKVASLYYCIIETRSRVNEFDFIREIVDQYGMIILGLDSWSTKGEKLPMWQETFKMDFIEAKNVAGNLWLDKDGAKRFIDVNTEDILQGNEIIFTKDIPTTDISIKIKLKGWEKNHLDKDTIQELDHFLGPDDIYAYNEWTEQLFITKNKSFYTLMLKNIWQITIENGGEAYGWPKEYETNNSFAYVVIYKGLPGEGWWVALHHKNLDNLQNTYFGEIDALPFVGSTTSNGSTEKSSFTAANEAVEYAINRYKIAEFMNHTELTAKFEKRYIQQEIPSQK